MEGHPPSGSANYGPGSKVAIPRLGRPQKEPPVAPEQSEKEKQNRVGRACTNCRKRKVKCSGETPRCKSCEVNELDCVYEQARKDRLRSATQRNETLVSLLKDLSVKVNNQDKKRIEDALEGVEDDLPARATSASTRALGKRARKDSPEIELEDINIGEANVSASVGSNEDLDLLDEDLLRSRESRETGYVGQNSEVQWLRSLQRQIEHGEEDTQGLPYGPPGKSQEAVDLRSEALHTRRRSSKVGPTPPVTESTFYLDNESIELDIIVDPHEIPPFDMAQRLFDCYIQTIHSTFPIVPSAFEDQFRKYYEAIHMHRDFHVPEKWLAILNLIFAIGARYSHLTNAEWQADERDHLVYMTRAIRLLGLKDTAMIISAPDLALIQATGILSLYYLVIGHVSRAWVMIGIAIRLALAVGLHLRNEDPSTPFNKKETLIRTWWSLHSIECLLSAITGRPCVLSNEDTTISLPQPLPEEQQRFSGVLRAVSQDQAILVPMQPSSSNSSPGLTRGVMLSGSYLDAHINIGIITQKALAGLYSPRTASKSWEYIQKETPSLLSELEEWYTKTFVGELSASHAPDDPQHKRERFLLQVYYCSTKIVITRPCLCRTERRIQAQSENSVNFNQRTAEECVHAAQQFTELFPDSPDPSYVYSNGPWWSIVHNMMQAIAALLLELSYGGSHTLSNGSELINCVKKLFRWLRAMRRTDPVTDRAYKVIINILRKCGPPFQATAAELLADHPFEDPRFKYPEGTEHAPSQHMDWQQGFYTDPSLESPPFDPQLFPSQQDTMTGFQAEPYSYFLPDQLQLPPGFGNPFVTSFDQDVQIPVSLEDLWPPLEELEMGGPGMDFSPHDQPPQ